MALKTISLNKKKRSACGNRTGLKKRSCHQKQKEVSGPKANLIENKSACGNRAGLTKTKLSKQERFRAKNEFDRRKKTPAGIGQA